jgi:hypothetical protein
MNNIINFYELDEVLGPEVRFLLTVSNQEKNY